MSQKQVTSIRIDKWLWAARFYKTRRLATEAIKSGHVLINNTRIKPSKIAAVNQRVTIKKSPTEWQVIILALSEHRQGAPIAQTLYQETQESILKREKESELRKAAINSMPSRTDRPTKRDRRKIIQFIQKEDESH